MKETEIKDDQQKVEKLSMLERKFEMMLAANRDATLLEAWVDLKQEIHNVFGEMLVEFKNKINEVKQA